jgi:hypothetical protein
MTDAFDAADNRDWLLRQWRAARMLRFAKRQEQERCWIRFIELAERYGRNIGVAEGYEQLRLAVMNGDFERAGRSRVLYLHPFAMHTKMTRDKMRNASETFPRTTLERHYLGCCWIPRDMAVAWCVARGVSVDGWLDGELPQRKGRGRPNLYDDSAALTVARDFMRRGVPIRYAAKQAAAVCGSKGNSPTAVEDRLRRKLGRGLAR